MKIHWGYAILIFFVCYVSLLGFTLFKSTTVDHTLVADNYYEQDLAYQVKYDAISNRGLLENDLKISIDQRSKSIVLFYGESPVSVKGKITLFRPAADQNDTVTSFEILDGTTYQMSSSGLQYGKWKVKVDWSDDKRKYFKEQDIYLSQS